MQCAPIGIIGAMDDEVKGLIARLNGGSEKEILGIKFYTGTIFDKSVVIAKCGVGKVFAAMCATVMMLEYKPRIIVNTGVGGALASDLVCGDTVIATKLVQHDMDTSALGDEVGMISGINKVFFDADERARETLLSAAQRLGLGARLGVIASGDRFVCSRDDKSTIVKKFGADVCEMEGAAIAHAAYVGGTPFAVVRAISDGANEEAMLDFPTFLKMAVKNSEALTLEFIKEF